MTGSIEVRERKVKLTFSIGLPSPKAQAQPNFYWAFQHVGPGSCWAQYPATQGPSPIDLYTRASRAFTDFNEQFLSLKLFLFFMLFNLIFEYLVV
jgi:hypothetical protein